MPLDPSIPLGGRTPEYQSPIGTLGRIAQLREMQQIGEQRRLLNESRQRDLDDDDAIRTALQRHGGNPDSAIDELYAAGRGTAASGLSKQLYDWRKAKGEELKLSLENTEKRLTMASQVAQSMTDEASFQSGKKAIAALLGKDTAELLGPMYDPDTVKQAVTWGTTRAEHLRAQNDAITNALAAGRLSLDAAKDHREHQQKVLEARPRWLASGAAFFSTAQDQDDWDFFGELLQKGGMPADLLQAFGPEWSPDAVQRALKLGMEPVEQVRTAGDAASRAETRRHNQTIEQETTRHNQANENAQGGVQNRGEAVAERWKADALAQLEKELKDNPYPRPTPEQVATRRLDIERSYWAQLGGEPALRKKMLDLADGIKTAKDEGAKKRMRQQLEHFRAVYSHMTGR